jgi:hypothetical protein
VNRRSRGPIDDGVVASAIDADVPHRRFVLRARTMRVLLRELRPVWLVSGVLAVAAAVCLAFPTPLTARLTGLTLQLLGLTVITTEVIRTWRRARMPAPREWLRRLASAIRPTTTSGATPERASGKGLSPAPLAKVPAGATLEQRVRVLEKNIEELRRDLTRGWRAQDKALTDVRQMVARDVEARHGAIGHAERALDIGGTRDVPLELVGLAWLWVGVLCASAPESMAAAAAWLVR